MVIVLAGLLVLHWHRQMPLLQEVRDKPLPYLHHWDSQSYMFIAQGRLAEVMSPFSKRALYPWMAKLLANEANLELGTSFMVLNVTAFMLLALCLTVMLEMLTAHAWLAIPLLLTPLPLESLELGYLPDLFHTALAALFFLLLLKDFEIAALVVLFFAFIVRESTLLLCLTCAVMGWLRGRKTLWIGSLVVLVAGTVITSVVAKHGQPNYHHLPDFVYLALKVPYNFLANYLGIYVWTNATSWVGEPLVRWKLPAFLQSQMHQEIGFRFEWRFPLTTLLVLLTVFGSGPLFLAALLKRLRTLLEVPLALQLAFLYGILCFFLGPALGNWVERLVGYAWPLFWLVIPWSMYRHCSEKVSVLQSTLLVGSYVLIAWWPSFFGGLEKPAFVWCVIGLLFYVPTVLSGRRILS
jgi:hypothetical protein